MTLAPYAAPTGTPGVSVTPTGTVVLLIDGVPMLDLPPWSMAALAARMATVSAEAALDSAREATDPTVLVARLAQVLGTPDGDRTTATLAAQLLLTSLGATTELAPVPAPPAVRALATLDQAEAATLAEKERTRIAGRRPAADAGAYVPRRRVARAGRTPALPGFNGYGHRRRVTGDPCGICNGPEDADGQLQHTADCRYGSKRSAGEAS